ncbi:MAG TPA: HEAT repeat domain-containing protein [Pyrinomonadaceae bacterium]|nr:HEAT repeat domain-containing protein [Pyrinomonadaceae bacterium]
MANVDQLIKQSRSADEKAEGAAAKLAALSMAAVTEIVASLREDSKTGAWNLARVLLTIRDPEIVPVFLDLMDDANVILRLTAFKGLGFWKDERGRQRLLTELTDQKKDEGRRTLAAQALGDIGDERSVAELRSIANEISKREDVVPAITAPAAVAIEINESALRLLISIAVALAKLGSHEMASTVVSLTRYRGGDEYSEDEVLRTEAVRALQSIVGPGVFAALQAALRDEYAEVWPAAIDALFYLGLKESIGELVALSEKGSPDAAHHALIRLRDLTGESFSGESAAGLSEWWAGHAADYQSNICYRMGKPIKLPTVIELLREPHLQDEVIRELIVITGERFGYNSYAPKKGRGDELHTRAQEWLKENGNRFTVGGLYKYGRKQEPKQVF